MEIVISIAPSQNIVFPYDGPKECHEAWDDFVHGYAVTKDGYDAYKLSHAEALNELAFGKDTPQDFIAKHCMDSATQKINPYKLENLQYAIEALVREQSLATGGKTSRAARELNKALGQNLATKWQQLREETGIEQHDLTRISREERRDYYAGLKDFMKMPEARLLNDALLALHERLIKGEGIQNFLKKHSLYTDKDDAVQEAQLAAGRALFTYDIHHMGAKGRPTTIRGFIARSINTYVPSRLELTEETASTSLDSYHLNNHKESPETIQDQRSGDPVIDAEYHEILQFIHRLMQYALGRNNREFHILGLRCGLGTDEKMYKLKDIGEVYKTAADYISQRQRGALAEVLGACPSAMVDIVKAFFEARQINITDDILNHANTLRRPEHDTQAYVLSILNTSLVDIVPPGSHAEAAVNSPEVARELFGASIRQFTSRLMQHALKDDSAGFRILSLRCGMVDKGTKYTQKDIGRFYTFPQADVGELQDQAVVKVLAACPDVLLAPVKAYLGSCGIEMTEAMSAQAENTCAPERNNPYYTPSILSKPLKLPFWMPITPFIMNCLKVDHAAWGPPLRQKLGDICLSGTDKRTTYILSDKHSLTLRRQKNYRREDKDHVRIFATPLAIGSIREEFGIPEKREGDWLSKKSFRDAIGIHTPRKEEFLHLWDKLEKACPPHSPDVTVPIAEGFTMAVGWRAPQKGHKSSLYVDAAHTAMDGVAEYLRENEKLWSSKNVFAMRLKIDNTNPGHLALWKEMEAACPAGTDHRVEYSLPDGTSVTLRRGAAPVDHLEIMADDAAIRNVNRTLGRLEKAGESWIGKKAFAHVLATGHKREEFVQFWHRLETLCPSGSADVPLILSGAQVTAGRRARQNQSDTLLVEIEAAPDGGMTREEAIARVKQFYERLKAGTVSVDDIGVGVKEKVVPFERPDEGAQPDANSFQHKVSGGRMRGRSR